MNYDWIAEMKFAGSMPNREAFQGIESMDREDARKDFCENHTLGGRPLLR